MTGFMHTMVLPLAHQSAFLKVIENKVQLISPITDNIWEYMIGYISAHHIIIPGPKDIPIKLKRVSPQPKNFESLEADTIMIHHMFARVNQNVAATIHVRCNDTDVFVLLCPFSDALNILKYPSPTYHQYMLLQDLVQPVSHMELA